MLFGEVLAGSSRAWFLDVWGLFVTLPLYLGHVLLLWMVAAKTKKTSLVQLYCLGMIFGLYEAFLTKVLWAGYWDQQNAGFGKFAGISMLEFPMLVFFWHPVMSFILPIIAFQKLTGKKLIADHEQLIAKGRWRGIALLILVALLSSFLASGAQFDVVAANLAFGGSLIIVLALGLAARGATMESLLFNRFGNLVLTAIMAVGYLVWTMLVLPQNLPTDAQSYVSIAIAYLVAIFMFLTAQPKPNNEAETEGFPRRYWVSLVTIYWVTLNFWLAVPDISTSVLSITYLALYGAGTLFAGTLLAGSIRRFVYPNR